MIELTSIDWLASTPRGDHAIFLGVNGLNPRLLPGTTVMVDGCARCVLRAETYAVMDATGMNFGLLLEPISTSPQGDGAGE